MTARLIVHADDFGRSVGLTEAVVEAFERGILTSASIVAAGPEFERLAQLVGPAAFVLDYHAAGLTSKNALHWVYRKRVRFPFYPRPRTPAPPTRAC